MAVPQSVSFAAMAGLPAAYGLYTAFVPVIAFCVMGSSRHLVRAWLWLLRGGECGWGTPQRRLLSLQRRMGILLGCSLHRAKLLSPFSSGCTTCGSPEFVHPSGRHHCFCHCMHGSTGSLSPGDSPSRLHHGALPAGVLSLP